MSRRTFFCKASDYAPCSSSRIKTCVTCIMRLDKLSSVVHLVMRFVVRLPSIKTDTCITYIISQDGLSSVVHLVMRLVVRLE